MADVCAMLKNERDHYQPRMIFVMSDMDILTATIKSTLREIAKQANALGTGLQNAAPGEKSEKPNNSVQYLLGIADVLEKASEDCSDILTESSQSTRKP